MPRTGDPAWNPGMYPGGIEPVHGRSSTMEPHGAIVWSLDPVSSPFSEGVFKCPEDQLPLDYAKVGPQSQAEALALGGGWQPVGSGPVST